MVSVTRPVMVQLVCAGRTGGRLISLTTTVKLLVALSGGVPLSVTTDVIVFVLGPCASSGVPVIPPLVSIPAPQGGATNSYVSGSAGTSESLALLVTVSVLNSFTVTSGCADSAGPL